MLDLFAGAGGAARGYQRAGFYVVGVDLKSQPRYAGDEFHQADAMTFDLSGYDAIHASPPCQQFTPLRARQAWKEYPDLVASIRERLVAAGVPYVIENVVQAPLTHGVVLCGGMFGLRTYRHRRFESSVLMWQPEHPPHVALTSTHKTRKHYAAGMHISVTGDVGSWVGPACMGIDWMQGRELAEAIPPAYTEWVGRRLLEALAAAPA